MNYTKPKILKEKTKDEEGGLAVLSRLTKLGFLPKFWVLDVKVLFSCIYYKRLILN
ncbi:MAG: hypothetical protein JWP09_896 [Candidatus Taylorbacteria bacterium]|nr:hypothetical protein [Candidatus Taylorbacteria bacterium]